MPRAKQPMGYPSAYYDMIEQVSQTGRTFVFPRRDKKQAELTRFQFYSFFKACRNSSEKREQAIGEAAYGLVLSIHGSDLVISVRDNLDEAQELKKALENYNRETIAEREAWRRANPQATHSSATHSSAIPPISPDGILPPPQHQVDVQEDMIARYVKGDKK